MFDSVLRRETLPKRRYGAGTFLGLVVYAAVAAFAFWAQANVRQHDKQDVAVTFVKPPPPPPPPPPAPAAVRPKVKTPTQQQTVLSQAIVAPTVIPDEKPPESEPVDTGNVHGEGDGVEGGEVGGVPGGIVGGVVDATDVRMEFDERMSPPEKLGGPDPKYTEKALEREVQGTMIVRCVVTTEGKVFGCRVLKSLPFMDRAVIDALERRRYRPATLGGRPVEVNYNFKITLRLPD
ncbi:MAG TPA: TonB family protein [Anaeromyxobacter sp.]|nr:TonB family protein [Anaeromyxobacter sp.]